MSLLYPVISLTYVIGQMRGVGIDFANILELPIATGLYVGMPLTIESVTNPFEYRPLVYLYRLPILFEWAARGDVTVHDERVVHGSGGNTSDRWRRAYIVAFRSAETVAWERAHGFTHSHNDAPDVLDGVGFARDSL